MRIQHLPVILGTSLILAAVGLGSTASELEPAPAEIVDDGPSQALAELARPQPERPDCDWCTNTLGAPEIAGDDELSIVLASTFVGHIDAVRFVSYTDTTKTTYHLDQSVIDDLNDPLTVETVLYVDTPEIVRGLLIFTVGTQDTYEPVQIIASSGT